ncbi:fibronectin type III domain-containing protein [Candidatus Protochlamydia sp. W-9]|uniref:fibronectin type III domain-containing protein n=1 Tax=Candidatus Protochlamydia sp. W-9 TaxID=1785087 RepID=UPI00096A239C|nr:fibronectin type III domain-containing protein [Candidatus Protochlamydia sp. W-9]
MSTTYTSNFNVEFKYNPSWFSYFISLLSIFCIFLNLSLYGDDLASETVYLTWQKDPTTTMTIQWISSKKEKEVQLFYRQSTEANWIQVKGIIFNFPHSPSYFINRVELTNLEPDTEYIFKIETNSQTHLFRTLPCSLQRPLRFVVGGDMYHDGIDLMIDICKQAAKTNPSFALVGGDIAYGVGESYIPLQKIERWIVWLKAWHQSMITPEGRLIPIIAAIGNHDLIGHYQQTPAQAKIFSSLFPMAETSIYNVFDFNSYLSIWLLDSGHANPVSGQQTTWLNRTLRERQHTQHRFAIYHVPAYPSIRNFNNKRSSIIRKFWVPAFEQGNLHAAFEHHDHAYKRTYPLLQNKIHPKGILYLGDGAWGIKKARQLKHTQPSYLAKFISIRHVIIVTLQSDKQYFMCINEYGQMIDEYQQNLESSHPNTISNFNYP